MSNLQLQDFVRVGRKIIGAAANYKSLLEIQKKPIPACPGIFLKPSTSYITENKPILIPSGFAVNEEIELGVIIGKSGKHIKENEAMDYVGGYCIALDMTATCKMEEARSTGGSWTVGKAFDSACPVSKFLPKQTVPDPHNVQLWCSINGEIRQNGNTNDLIFTIPQLISFISQFMTLEVNDLIITGSPPGMGPVHPGDVIEGGVKGLVDIKYIVKSDETK